MSETLPDVEVTAEATSGSIDNLKFVGSGKADIGFTMADTLDDAVKGQGAFREGGPVKALALAALIDNFTHVATFAGSGITSLADLKGRVVSVGAPGSGTETIALRILEAAGIDSATGIRRQGLGVNASVDALKDGKLDAFFWSSGVPAGSILDLAATPGHQMALLPSDTLLPELQRRHGGLYALGAIPKGAYAGLEADVPVNHGEEPARGQRVDGRGAGLPPHTHALREAEGARSDPPRGPASLPRACHAGLTRSFPSRAIRYYKEKAAWRS